MGGWLAGWLLLLSHGLCSACLLCCAAVCDATLCILILKFEPGIRELPRTGGASDSLLPSFIMLSSLLLGVTAVAAAPAPKVPTLEIAPGVHLPMTGLGTWQYNDTIAEAAVSLALSLGYPHIDTAIGYNNQVGIARALKASKRPRSSYFITSKVPGGLTQAAATAQLEQSVQQLVRVLCILHRAPTSGVPPSPPSNAGDGFLQGLDYVDLMLVHFPASWGGKGGKALRQAQWKAMEAFVGAGKAKAIGVSHYCERHIDDIMEIATIKPAINQVQMHVGMGTEGLNATDQRIPHSKSEQPTYKGVYFQSFSPLCGPCGTTELIDGPLVTKIGKNHKKSGAQVSLKWLVQMGIPVIPKCQVQTYMLENLDLFSWELTDDEMEQLAAATKPPVAGDPDGSSGDCKVE
jgi:diketogulonate reductase-like aldo/keto reductase